MVIVPEESLLSSGGYPLLPERIVKERRMRARTAHRLGLEGLELEGFSVESQGERKGITICTISTTTKGQVPGVRLVLREGT